MKTNIIFLCVLITVNAITDEELTEQWEAFKLTYNKQYETESEELIRKKIFLRRSEIISEHNKHYGGEVTYKMGINKYSDLTDEEFSKAMFGINGTRYSLKKDEGATFIAPEVKHIPESVDWRIEDAVTPVQDQFPCGTCWSFSAAGALEGQHFRKTGVLIPLSKQNLLDCTRSFGNRGCAVGMPSYAFNYIRANGGIDAEFSYPYIGIENKTCRYNKIYSAATVEGYMNVPKTERQLKIAVATKGPISVIIDASSLQNYEEGVFFDKTCSNDLRKLNHAVLVVGYGKANRGGPYWIIKNSWGITFGEGGYFRLARNRRNHCGVANVATVPIV